MRMTALLVKGHRHMCRSMQCRGSQVIRDNEQNEHDTTTIVSIMLKSWLHWSLLVVEINLFLGRRAGKPKHALPEWRFNHDIDRKPTLSVGAIYEKSSASVVS